MTQNSAAEPVSVADYQAYMRTPNVSIPIDVFNGRARAARRACEKFCGRVFVSQVWIATIDLPPGVTSPLASILSRFYGYVPESIELPYAPLRQVSSITVTDNEGNVNVVDPSAYWVSTATDPGRIALRNNSIWPDTTGRSFESFNIQYTVGYSIPFTASGAVLTTTQPHGLVNGSVQRVWTTSDGTLYSGLSPDTDYYVVNAGASTLGLSLTAGGSPISVTGTPQGAQFLGELPDNFKRAILATTAVDFFPDKKKASRYDVSEAGTLPDLAKQLLELDVVVNL